MLLAEEANSQPLNSIRLLLREYVGVLLQGESHTPVTEAHRNDMRSDPRL